MPNVVTIFRERSCDHQGEGPYNQACVFPFTFEVWEILLSWPVVPAGHLHFPWGWQLVLHQDSSRGTCTRCSFIMSWLLTSGPLGYWGVCTPSDRELAQGTLSNSSKTCTNSQFHICTAQVESFQTRTDLTPSKWGSLSNIALPGQLGLLRGWLGGEESEDGGEDTRGTGIYVPYHQVLTLNKGWI